jgi:DNA-binding transcriptional ArsR family regulator
MATALTDVFGALADDTRLRLISLLVEEGEFCVCELVAALDLSQPKISRHLAVLRGLRLVSDRRDANRVFYRLSPDLPAPVRVILQTVADTPKAAEDLEYARSRLARMPGRPGVERRA